MSFAGTDSRDRVDGERSWAKVVQGSSRSPAWFSYKISEEDVDHLQRYFSEVLELMGLLLEDSRR